MCVRHVLLQLPCARRGGGGGGAIHGLSRKNPRHVKPLGFPRVRPAHTNATKFGPNKSGPVLLNLIIFHLINLLFYIRINFELI